MNTLYKKRVGFICMLFFNMCALTAQPLPSQKICLAVGDTLPALSFSDFSDSSIQRVTTESYRGHWLVLNFWNSHCMACLEEMPLLDSLSREMVSEAGFILVGYSGSQYARRSDHERIRRIYQRTRSFAGITLPTAYDSTVFHQLDIEECPYLLVIDPKGIIRAITVHITRQQLRQLMAGKAVVFEKAYTRTQRRNARKEQKK